MDLVRNGTGRIVIVSSSAGIRQAPAEGIMFDNLDGRRFYEPLAFYGQSKLANALFAKELSRRLSARGIAVNSLHPGATRGTGLNRNLTLPLRIVLSAAKWFMKSAPQGAATQALLAAHPSVGGISGEYWTNCRIAAGQSPARGRRPCRAPVEGIGGHRRAAWPCGGETIARGCLSANFAIRGSRLYDAANCASSSPSSPSSLPAPASSSRAEYVEGHE